MDLMTDVLSAEERETIPELVAIVAKLPEEDQRHLLWLGQGILFASQYGKKHDRG